MNKLSFLLLFCVVNTLIHSQLILKEIMSGSDFIGYLPENQRWNADGTSILFDWNQGKNFGNSLYQFSLLTNKHELVKSAEFINCVEFDVNQKQFPNQIYTKGNAVFNYDKKSKKSQLIYQSSEAISQFSRLNDPSKVVFQIGQNLFLWSGTSFVQMTNFKAGEHSSTKIDSTILMKQQDELFSFIRIKNERKDWYEKQKKEFTVPFPKEQFYGSGRLVSLQIHPSGKYVTLINSHDTKEKPTAVEQFITVDGYTKSNVAREKVSQNEPNQSLMIYQFERDTLINIDCSNLSFIRRKPAYLKDENNPNYEKDRSIFIHPLVFSSTKNTALCDIRSADNKDRWIVLIDLEKATIKEVEHQHDEAWIGGPGISSWNTEIGTLDWLEDGKTFYFQSEETGFSHLYLYDLENNSKSILTEGKFEIHNVQLSANKKLFYITPNNRKLIFSLSQNLFHASID